MREVARNEKRWYARKDTQARKWNRNLAREKETARKKGSKELNK